MWYDFLLVAINWTIASWIHFFIVIGVLVVIGALLVWWAQKTDGITYIAVVYFIIAVAVILILLMIQDGIVVVPNPMELM